MWECGTIECIQSFTNWLKNWLAPGVLDECLIEHFKDRLIPNDFITKHFFSPPTRKKVSSNKTAFTE